MKYTTTINSFKFNSKFYFANGYLAYDTLRSSEDSFKKKLKTCVTQCCSKAAQTNRKNPRKNVSILFSIIQQTRQFLKNKNKNMSSNNLFRVLTSSICDINVVNRNGSVWSDVAYYYCSSYCNMVHVLKIKSMLEKFPRLCIHSMSNITMVSTATVVL